MYSRSDGPNGTYMDWFGIELVKSLARITPAGKLRVELSGLEAAYGRTASQPAWLSLVAVRLPVTAMAELKGAPSAYVWQSCGVNDADPWSFRVSTMRSGVTGVKVPPRSSFLKYPVTSMMTSAVPLAVPSVTHTTPP